jgi:hypothetical protein
MRVCSDCGDPISRKARRCNRCSNLASPRGVEVRSLAERLWARVDKSGDCWLWTGHVTPKGRGQINRGARGEGIAQVHVVAWELTFGPVPPGRELHHTCFTPLCCRPDHLQPLTPVEHRAAHVAAKTTCKHGHDLDGWDNVRQRRFCRTCKRGWGRARYARKRAAA